MQIPKVDSQKTSANHCTFALILSSNDFLLFVLLQEEEVSVDGIVCKVDDMKDGE